MKRTGKGEAWTGLDWTMERKTGKGERGKRGVEQIERC